MNIYKRLWNWHWREIGRLVLQTLTLIFGEEAVLMLFPRCWELDDLGWANQIDGLPQELLCGLLGMTACAPAEHPLQNLWSVGSFDDLFIGFHRKYSRLSSS